MGRNAAARTATIPGMSTGDAHTVDAYCMWLAAAGRAPGTVALRRKQLRAAARDIPLPVATVGELVAYLAGRDR